MITTPWNIFNSDEDTWFSLINCAFNLALPFPDYDLEVFHTHTDRARIQKKIQLWHQLVKQFYFPLVLAWPLKHSVIQI